MKKAIAAIVIALIAGCAGAPITSSNNVYRSTLSDNPIHYLKGFALGTVRTKDSKIGKFHQIGIATIDNQQSTIMLFV